MNVVETRGLTKYYGKSRGINDVSLTVESGDFFGFIGPNGAGKSTTIRLLLGLLRPTSGSSTVFGLDSVKDRIEILKRVGYLSSETSFWGGATVSETIAYSASLRRCDCSHRAAELCERLELARNAKIRSLSLGNRKKVGIVCALQHDPELCVFDEPTSGLDPLMQREFYNIIGERNAEGATVFLSSHILSEVGRYCKRAAVIRDGGIVACRNISDIENTGFKRVTLRGTENIVPERAFDASYEDGTLSFLYGGTARELVDLLSVLRFDDFSVTDPDLEEVFIHFYEKEESAK